MGHYCIICGNKIVGIKSPGHQENYEYTYYVTNLILGSISIDILCWYDKCSTTI